ncbi:MAG: type IV secretion protein Rhs, partial [Phototrophicales bacterium]
CLGSETQIVYDANGFKDYQIDGRGIVTDYTIQNGLETERREGYTLVNNEITPTEDARTIETHWNTFPSPIGTVTLVEEVREEGVTTTYTYEHGRVKTITQTDTTTHTEPYGTNGTTRVWTYHYSYHDDQNRRIHTITVDGPRSDVVDTVIQTFNESGWLTRTERRISDELTLTRQITEHDP